MDGWAGGITNPLTVIEQLTYLMFIRLLDEKELENESLILLPLRIKEYSLKDEAFEVYLKVFNQLKELTPVPNHDGNNMATGSNI